MREIIGESHPRRIFEFGDKLHKRLQEENKQEQELRERSGKISGGKLGKPTLWAVLDILGVPDEDKDPYLLGKFKRGNDVEDRAIEFLTEFDSSIIIPGEEFTTEDTAILQGTFVSQKESGYRGGVGFVDLAQKVGDQEIYHEVKSVTKMAYDKVAATGATARAAERRGEKPRPEPYYHHELQLAYYCLGDNVNMAFLHYFNADDYRLCTFSINPIDYKEEIDKEIDDIEASFLSKRLPPFEGFLDFHKLKKYWSYKDWNELTPDQMMDKLKSEYPEAYERLMKGEI